MKNIIITTLAILIVLALTIIISVPQTKASGGFDPEACTYDGKPLYGRVQIVDHFADVKVKIVSSLADLKVKKVEHFADDCGEWQIVEHFPDIKVQIVESFPDITVEYVDHFPGAR